MTLFFTFVAMVVMFLALRALGLTIAQYAIATFVSCFGLIFGWMGSAILFWLMVIYFGKENDKKKAAAPSPDEEEA